MRLLADTLYSLCNYFEKKEKIVLAHRLFKNRDFVFLADNDAVLRIVLYDTSTPSRPNNSKNLAKIFTGRFQEGT